MPEVYNSGHYNCKILKEHRRIDAVAVNRKPSLILCTTLEVEAHYGRKNYRCHCG